MIRYKKVSTVLRQAREYLVEHGWTKGDYCNRGRVCMLGAVRAVIAGDAMQPVLDPADRIRDALAAAIGPCQDGDLASWNDAKPRTKAHVLAVFAAAEKAELAKERRGLGKKVVCVG